MPFSPFCRSTLQKFLDFSHKTSSVFLEKRVRSSKSDRSACEPHRHKLAPARNEEEYNSIEIGAILQYADEQIEVVGKRYGRLPYNSYAESTGKPVFPKDMKFYYNYKYLDGKRVDKPKRFVIPKDE